MPADEISLFCTIIHILRQCLGRSECIPHLKLNIHPPSPKLLQAKVAKDTMQINKASDTLIWYCTSFCSILSWQVWSFSEKMSDTTLSKALCLGQKKLGPICGCHNKLQQRSYIRPLTSLLIYFCWWVYYRLPVNLWSLQRGYTSLKEQSELKLFAYIIEPR